ncbi:MAG TPA: putative Ig domain-containing protein, partial [Candidatus Dormibacteraeota bacterium]|nr:putative Ig domain-containing protein [Candidatus Dormibacteraeota bacterium]
MKSAFRRSVGFVWALGLASLLTASVVVPAQATATPVVDQQQTFYSPGMGHTSGQVAQTFTAGMTGVLDHVSLVTATNYGARITVEILNTGSNGAPTGAPLGTSTPQYLTCCAQWHDFTFSPAVQVTSGTRYAIVVPINSAYVTWWYMPSDPYPGGQMWVTFCPSCNWLSGMQYGVDYSTLDFAFETWVLSAGGANSAPTLTEAGSEAGAGEGTSPTMTGTFSDSDGDTVALTADKGTLTAPAGASSGAWSWTEPAADESPTQTVTVTATDSHGLAASVHFAVNIGGVAPAVRITSDPVSSPEGATVQLTGAATSPDAADNAGVFTFAWTVTKDGSPYATGSGAAWS